MPPQVSFTTIVRKSQTLGGETKSSQDGDMLILVAVFPDKGTAEEMRYYALDKGWNVPDEVIKQGNGYGITIFPPPEVDYRALLKKYIVVGGAVECAFADDEWQAVLEILEEIKKEQFKRKKKATKKKKAKRIKRK